MKRFLIFSVLSALLSGCVVVPARDNYRGHGYYDRDDGYYYRGDGYYRGHGDRGYGGYGYRDPYGYRDHGG